MKYVVIFTGGTMVHVTPHFSLCAPAYGQVGEGFQRRLSSAGKLSLLHRSRMAGGSFETNEDLEDLLEVVLTDPNLGAIVFAAAVCDFEPVSLTDGTEVMTEFGKSQKRLSSNDLVSIELRGSDKIVRKIKQQRPDVHLTTFKTTSGDPEAMVEKGKENLDKTGADQVICNDIKTHDNILMTRSGTLTHEPRGSCIDLAVEKILEAI